MQKKFLLWGLTLGTIAVIIGALGAHALKPYFTPDQQSSFETGVKYQMYHALLFLLIASIEKLQSKTVLYLLGIGIIFFSLSIYLLNLKSILNMEFLSFLGPITPIGGLLLISGWLMLILRTLKIKNSPL